MSKDLQNKLYNHEVPPPATAWEHIAAALDEAHLSDQFPSTLYNSTATPPPAAWDRIAHSLEEATPKARYAAALYNMEALPPASAWNKIKTLLEQVATTPARVRSLSWLRYVAAAAVLVAVAFMAINLFQPGNQRLAETINDTLPKQTDNKNITPSNNNNTENNTSTNNEDDQRNEKALEESKQTYASLDLADRQRVNRIAADLLVAPASTISASSGIAPENTYRDPHCTDVATAVYTSSNSSIDMATRYATLLTPDGNLIRISKKLGNLVCCVSGEEQDESCTDQLKKWRQRIADSPVAPSPGNFMDILSLVQTLQDNSL